MIALLGTLGSQLRGGACELATANFRIQIPAFGVYTYPDASVTCGPPQCTDEVRDTFTNPCLIVEVLSDSTNNYDRGEKFRYYRYERVVLQACPADLPLWPGTVTGYLRREEIYENEKADG